MGKEKKPGDQLMGKIDLGSMSVEQLWNLHEQVASMLAEKITAEKAKLEDRLRKIGAAGANVSVSRSRERRPYPTVLPKYQNPNGSETWSGRGKQPRWLVAQLRAGAKLEDFQISRASGAKRRAAPD